MLFSLAKNPFVFLGTLQFVRESDENAAMMCHHHHHSPERQFNSPDCEHFGYHSLNLV